MVRDLLTVLREHGSYQPNPYIDSYLAERQANVGVNLDLTVRRMSVVLAAEALAAPQPVMIAPSTSSGQIMEAVGGRGDTGGHERCITPAPDNGHSDVECLFCHSPAINPMRCTRPEERNRPYVDDNYYDDRDSADTHHHHVLCYQCMAQNMIRVNAPFFPCPYRCGNEFATARLRTDTHSRTLMAEELRIECPNNCGLMGSPAALAVHICPLAPDHHIGHTRQSRAIQELQEANDRLRRQLEVQRLDYEDDRRRQEVRCQALEANYQTLEDKYLTVLNVDVSNYARRIGAADRTNRYLYEELLKQNELLADKDTHIERCRQDLEDMQYMWESDRQRLYAHYEPLVQQLTADKERLAEEIRLLLGSSDGPAGARLRAYVWNNTALNQVSGGSTSAPTTPSTDDSLGIRHMFATPPASLVAITEPATDTDYEDLSDEAVPEPINQYPEPIDTDSDGSAEPVVDSQPTRPAPSFCSFQ